MNHACKTLFAGVGVVAVIFAPATAAGFMDDFFAAPQASWSNDPREYAPYPPFGGWRREAPWAGRIVHASRRKRERRPRHVEARISYPAPREGDPKIQAHLASPAFTQRFSEAPVSGAPDGADEALAYLLQNDPTLRAGDAVVTRAGVLVLGSGRHTREFVPVARSHLRRGVKARLLAFVPAGPASRQRERRRAATPVAFTPRLDSPAEKLSFRNSDGRVIRIVGGASGR
jgi:hypothetical protein